MSIWQRIRDLMPMPQAQVDEIVGPSTFTCTDCGQVVEVWRDTEPFEVGDLRVCACVRDSEYQIGRINTLRFGCMSLG